jgi:hypothetical protein
MNRQEFLRIYDIGHQQERALYEAKVLEAQSTLDLESVELLAMVGIAYDLVHGALQAGLTVTKIIDSSILLNVRCSGKISTGESQNEVSSGHTPRFLINILDNLGNPTSFCPTHPFNELSKKEEA